MHTIILNVRDFLYEIPENLTIKIKPQSVVADGTTLLLNAPLFFKDGDIAVLPAAIYSVELSGGNVKQIGWIDLDRDGTLADLFNIAISPADIPTSLPIEAINGLRAELDLINAKAENALSPQQLAKLEGIENQATKNQPDSFLLDRANHTGTQPANSVDGLPGLFTSVSNLGTSLAGKQDTNARLTSLVNLSNPVASVTLGLSSAGSVIVQNPADQLASTSNPGFMSSLDKIKLDGIATGATANSTDSQLRDRSTHTGNQPISSITGLQAAIDNRQPISTRLTTIASSANPASHQFIVQRPDGGIEYHPTSGYALAGHGHNDVTTTTSGFLSPGDKIKLNGIATGATANSTDAQLRDRATHTGSQAISTVTGLQAALDGKQNLNTRLTQLTQLSSSNNMLLVLTWDGQISMLGQDSTFASLRNRTTHTGTQPISSVNGLQTALDGKAASSHTHVAADITDFTTAVRSQFTAGSNITISNGVISATGSGGTTQQWQTTFTDNFTRANGSIGNGWNNAKSNGSITIDSNRASLTRVSGIEPIAVRPISESNLNQEAILYWTASATHGAYVYNRMQDSNNTYGAYVYFGTMTVVDITRIVGGTTTSLLTPTIPAIVIGNNYSLRIRCTGTNPTTIEVELRNETTGTQSGLWTVTDSTAALQTVGLTGFGNTADPTSFFNRFEVNTLVTVATNYGGFDYWGSAVPSSPTNGQLWREFRAIGTYDWRFITGVGWVSMTEYSDKNDFTAGVVGGWARWLSIPRQGSGVYITSAFVFFFTGTAHDATNRLTIIFNNFQPNGTVTALTAAKTTSATANSTNTLQLLDSPVYLSNDNHGIFRFNAAQTGSVNTSFQVCVNYHIVR